MFLKSNLKKFKNTVHNLKTLNKKLFPTYHFHCYVNTLKCQEHNDKVLSVFPMHLFDPPPKVNWPINVSVGVVKHTTRLEVAAGSGILIEIWSIRDSSWKIDRLPVFHRTIVLKNFIIFIEKHQGWSQFFIKLQA